MQAPSSNELQILVLVGVIIVILLVRTIRLAKGVRFSLQRFMIRLGFYGFLFADVLAGEIYFDGLPWYSWVGDLVLAGVCALLFVPYAERTTAFFQDPKGGLRYRFPVYASMAYLLLYGVRLGLELLFVPGALEFSSTVPTAVPSRVRDTRGRGRSVRSECRPRLRPVRGGLAGVASLDPGK